MDNNNSRSRGGRGAKRPRSDGPSHGGNRNWQGRNGRPRRHQHRPPPRGGGSDVPPTHNHDSSKRRNPASSQQQQPPPLCSVCHKEEHPKYKCPKCREAYCSIACCQQHKITCSVQQQLLPTEAGTQQQQQQQQDLLPDGKQRQHRSKYLPLMQRDVAGTEISANQAQQFDGEFRHDDGRGDKNEIDDDDNDLEEGWKITPSMKESMHHCSWLQNELQDAGLRQLITQVVASSRIVQRNGKTAQEIVLDSTKATNPMFTSFCDKLLVVTGILERQDHENLTHGNSNNGLEEWLERGPDELGQLVLKPIPSRQARMVVEPANMFKSDSSEDSSSDETSSEESSESSSSSDNDESN